MKKHPNLRVALSAVAGIVGAGFASGREIMTFFSRMGAASYLGIITASVCAGLLSAMIVHFSKKTGAKTFPGIYTAEMGRVCGESVDVLYGLMLLLTGAAMCAAGGEIAALALPIYFARPFGIAVTLLAALYTVYGGRRSLAVLGAALVPIIVIFYFALFLDNRPVSTQAATGAVGVLSSIPVSLVMGIFYASFNVSMAGGVLCLHCDEDVNPEKVGLLIGGCLLIMLVPANAALLRAGPSLRLMSFPAVILASRWGTFGFYACVIIFWMAIVSTLGAVLAPLIRQVKDLPFAFFDKAAAPLVIVFTVLMSVVGFSPLVDVGYPLLGWACTFIMLALLAFL